MDCPPVSFPPLVSSGLRPPRGASAARGKTASVAQPTIATSNPPKVPTTCKVHKIEFTELVAEGSTELHARTVRVVLGDEPVKPLVVYDDDGEMNALDNESLFVYLNAFVDEVPIIVRPKPQPERADPHKSARSSSMNQYHWEYNNEVLDWTIDDLFKVRSDLDPLLDHYEYAEDYSKRFPSLIFEETRARLEQGVMQRENAQNTSSLKCVGYDDQKPELTLLTKNCSIDIRIGDALYLKKGSLQCIGLVKYLEGNVVMVGLSNTVANHIYASDIKCRGYWKVKKLDSLVTFQRMYASIKCFRSLDKYNPALTDHILGGTFAGPLYVGSEEVNEQIIDFSKNGLNYYQDQVIDAFVKLEKGLHMIQGPPGTGKTTTIVALLAALIAEKPTEKILVCAPSNKAVQIIAQRFIQENPQCPTLLVGVEDKLPSDSPLRTIFFDELTEQWEAFLHSIVDDIRKVHQDLTRLILYQEVFAAFQEIEEKFDDFVQFAGKYQLKHFDTMINWFEQVMVNVSRMQFNGRYMIEHHRYLTWQLSTLSFIVSSCTMKLVKFDINDALLKKTQITFMTLSTAGQGRMEEHVRSCGILIIDEASQALEAETLIPMTIGTNTCLIVGDQKQLPPLVISQAAGRVQFGRSLMERLSLKRQPALLRMQYRMHPEISRWPSQTYYGNALIDARSVHEHIFLKDMPSHLAPYAFIHVDGQEQELERSFLNTQEVHIVASVVDHLAQLGIQVASQVAIISFYSAQVNAISHMLKGRYPNIKVATVDSFQGGENDIIIKSCVRANLTEKIGFLKEAKRLNVALTRAKFSLIIVGNRPTLERSDLADLVADARKRNVLFDAKHLYAKKEVEKLPPPKTVKANRERADYKTTLCRYYLNEGGCRQGDRCTYAHGDAELRYRITK